MTLINESLENDYVTICVNPRGNIWVDTNSACEGFELTKERWSAVKKFIDSQFKKTQNEAN